MKRHVLLGIALLLIASTALGSWYDDYNDGIAAVRKGQWQIVIQKMTSALAGNSKENNNARTYGNIFINYHPYYYRGFAYLRVGQYEKAISDFEKPEGPGEIDRGSIDELMQPPQRAMTTSRQHWHRPTTRSCSLTRRCLRMCLRQRFRRPPPHRVPSSLQTACSATRPSAFVTRSRVISMATLKTLRRSSRDFRRKCRETAGSGPSSALRNIRSMRSKQTSHTEQRRSSRSARRANIARGRAACRKSTSRNASGLRSSGRRGIGPADVGPAL